MEGINPAVVMILKLLMGLVGFLAVIVVGGLLFSKIMNKGFEFSEKLEKKSSKGKDIDPFWPTISDKEVATIVARKSSYSIFIIAFITALCSWFHFLGLSSLGFIDAAILTLVALGLFFMSRVAAVLGLSVYILGKVYALITYLAIPQAFWVILIVLIYINGIRATFAYHKFEPEEVIRL